MLTARSERFQIPEAQHQFQGFAGVAGGGIFIPAFGGGGAFPALIPGGPIGAGGSGVNPLSTLEGAFGTGFTARSVADAILVAEQEGRFSAESTLTGLLDIATGPVVRLVLNLARGLFEILDRGGKVVGVGVTPEAALESLNAGGGILAGGGGGQEPPPFFPRRSRPSLPLPLSHLRRLKPRSDKTSSARSRRSFPSFNQVDQVEGFQRSPDLLPRSSRYYPVERSTCPWSSARRAIPPEYDVRAFQIRKNSPARSRSVESLRTCSRSEKHGRTPTSSAEPLSNFWPRGWNN